MYTSTWILMVALFVTVKNWKQSKQLLGVNGKTNHSAFFEHNPTEQ